MSICRKFTLSLVAGAVCAALAPLATQAYVVNIDTFNSPLDPYTLTATGGNGVTATSDQDSVPETVGLAHRVATATVVDPSMVATGSVYMTLYGLNVTDPPVNSSPASETVAGKWSMAYDWAGGSVNLAHWGFDRIDIDYLSYGDNYLNMKLTVSDGTNTDFVEQTLASTGGNFVTASFYYADFTNIDFSNVTSIILDYAGVESDGTTPALDGDYGLSQFRAIPEPASVFLLLGGAGLLASRRRR